MLGLDNLTRHLDFGGREYRGVSPQPMNSIHTTAEVDQSKENEHAPKGEDPVLDFRTQRQPPLAQNAPASPRSRNQGVQPAE